MEELILATEWSGKEKERRTQMGNFATNLGILNVSISISILCLLENFLTPSTTLKLERTNNDHLKIFPRILGKLAYTDLFGFWSSIRGFHFLAVNETGNFTMGFDNYDVSISGLILYLLENLLIS